MKPFALLRQSIFLFFQCIRPLIYNCVLDLNTFSEFVDCTPTELIDDLLSVFHDRPQQIELTGVETDVNVKKTARIFTHPTFLNCTPIAIHDHGNGLYSMEMFLPWLHAKCRLTDKIHTS
jgi:hypothetical protein